MPPSILVAYSTQSGSTAEVAGAIAESFRELGLKTDLLPVSQVRSPSGWTAILLGVPLYVGRFPKEFRRFLALQRDALAPLPTWCFVLGPTRTEPADFVAARKQAEKQLARFPWFHPVELRIFGGRWDATHLPFPFTLVRFLPANPLNRIPASDIRDWQEIRAWGQGIARKFVPAA